MAWPLLGRKPGGFREGGNFRADDAWHVIDIPFGDLDPSAPSGGRPALVRELFRCAAYRRGLRATKIRNASCTF
jgi:hypothetical protein